MGAGIQKLRPPGAFREQDGAGGDPEEEAKAQALLFQGLVHPQVHHHDWTAGGLGPRHLQA